jgi:vitamin B12 transporter
MRASIHSHSRRCPCGSVRSGPVRPVLAAAALAVTTLAWAESGGALSGSVRTETGTTLPQVVLVLEGPNGSRTVVTGPDGGYRVTGLPAGEYRLRPSTAGFRATPDARVTVGGEEAHLDIALAPAPVREQVVVTATRSDAVASEVGVTTSVLDTERIADREPSSLLQLLQDLPGVAVARTGGIGQQASAFVRGGESRYVRILVDGVPVNQPGGAFDFGSAEPLELERVELVRGAASSLFGSDALAGALQLVTRRAGPNEGVSFRGEAEGGRFDWKRVQGASSGRFSRFDWNAGLLRLETDNQEPNSAFRETAGALTAGAALSSGSALRLVLRVEDSTTGAPGQTAFGRPDLDAHFDRTDVMGGAQLRIASRSAVHDVRFGFARTDQLSVDPLDSGSYLPRSGDRVGAFVVSDFVNPAGFSNDGRRATLGYQVDLQAGPRSLLTAGIDFERETGRLGDRSGELLRPERNNGGLFVQDRILVGDRLHLTAGGRLEKNDSFGTAFVPRGALAFRLRGGPDATTFKASAGAGIKEPTFAESFGVSFFAKGNPDLEPERSRTFDLGIEQRALGGRLRLEATGFHHDYRDQVAFTVLDFTTFQGSYVNLGHARARGLELSGEAALGALQLSADYTYLDGKVLVSTSSFDPVYAVGQPLVRRPKHQASASARVTSGRVDWAATLVRVGRRADSDFLGIGLAENEGYTRLDGRVRARLGRGIEAFLVGENLLDRRYQEALGYPALGRSVRLGLRLRGGADRRP